MERESSEPCAHCKATCRVSTGYRCTAECGRLYHGKCLKSVGIGEPPSNRLIICKLCVDKQTGGQPKRPPLLSIPSGPVSTGDEVSLLSPQITPLHEFEVAGLAAVRTEERYAAGQEPVTASHLDTVVTRLENSLGTLIGKLTGKVESVLSRLDRTEAQIAAIHAENTELAVKVDNNFTVLSSRIDAINAELPSRIGAIAATLPPTHPSGPPVDIDSVTRELFEREKRKKNIMIFGLREPETAAADNAEIIGLLSMLVPGLSPTLVHITRLGTPGGGRPRPRPIKVALQSLDTVIAVFRSAHLLRQHARYSGIVIRSDKTPAQEAAYKKLREQVKIRTDQGEQGLKIVTRSGAPVIVSQSYVSRASNADAQQFGLSLSHAGEGAETIPAHPSSQSQLRQLDSDLGYLQPHAQQLQHSSQSLPQQRQREANLTDVPPHVSQPLHTTGAVRRGGSLAASTSTGLSPYGTPFTPLARAPVSRHGAPTPIGYLPATATTVPQHYPRLAPPIGIPTCNGEYLTRADGLAGYTEPAHGYTTAQLRTGRNSHVEAAHMEEGPHSHAA